MLKLSSKSLKVSMVIPSGELFGVTMPGGASRVPAEIKVGTRVVRAEFNGKSLRKAIAAVDAGGEIAVVIQGRLESGDHLVDAGISALQRATAAKQDAAD